MPQNAVGTHHAATLGGLKKRSSSTWQARNWSKLIAVLIAVTPPILSGACRDAPTSLPVHASIDDAGQCTGVDPNPDSAGVYLGICDAIECINSGAVDRDGDGLADLCEAALAPAFAPELALCNCDGGAGREPHWVAMPLSPTIVRLGYLLSYYRDWGTQDPFTCLNFLPEEWCYGHAGDSEDIFLDVYYDATKQHWVLKTASYSHHGDYTIYAPGPDGYPTLVTYPTHQGSYPRAWVSTNKHANYASQPECDGAQFGFEDCHADYFERVNAGNVFNLGSRTVPQQDCMASSNPLYQGNGVTECYWTENSTMPGYFSGWQGFQPAASSSSPKLANFGF